LKIAAKVDAVDRDYFESEIRKLLAPPDVFLSWSRGQCTMWVRSTVCVSWNLSEMLKVR
jgi:hypothetical protein